MFLTVASTAVTAEGAACAGSLRAFAGDVTLLATLVADGLLLFSAV